MADVINLLLSADSLVREILSNVSTGPFAQALKLLGRHMHPSSYKRVV